jgi:iron complex transport system ATP-binding protein
MNRSPPATRLSGCDLRLCYGERTVAENISVAIPDGVFTAIIGPNGCGKSTVLRALSRLLKPARGHVLLDGKDIHTQSPRYVARQLGLLPQSAISPPGITVADLVARGRHPHARFLRQWSEADEAAVTAALIATGMTALADRPLDRLSGGQRQRAWIAMALAQETSLLLLDEPTTYLDLAHQIDLMELLGDLNTRQQRTLVAVLHDLNQACRHAGHLIAMQDGRIVAEGEPSRIVDAALVEAVFGVAALVIDDPVSGTPLVIPRRRDRAISRQVESPAGSEITERL